MQVRPIKPMKLMLSCCIIMSVSLQKSMTQYIFTASQVANNLIQSLEATAEQCPLPVLVTEVVPDGQFVSNVKGKKPIVFDVGKDEDEGGASKESGSL